MLCCVSCLIIFLAVVRLTPNVALKGTATQSATHVNTWDTSPFIASYANDGNFETSMTETSGACSFAERNKPPVWWQVDLLNVYEITKVAITGRQRFNSMPSTTVIIQCIFKLFKFNSQFEFANIANISLNQMI